MLFAGLCLLVFSHFDQTLPQRIKTIHGGSNSLDLDDGSSPLNNLQDRKGEPVKAEKTNARLKSRSKFIFLSPEQDSGRILLRQGAPKNAGMPKRMLLHDTFFRTLWRADVHWHCNTTPYRSSLGFVGDVRILMGYVNGNTDNGIPILKADGCDMTRKCRNQSCVRQSQEDRTREDPLRSETTLLLYQGRCSTT